MTDLQKYKDFFDEMNIGYTTRNCVGYDDENDEEIELISLSINKEHIYYTDDGNYLDIIFYFDTEKFIGFEPAED